MGQSWDIWGHKSGFIHFIIHPSHLQREERRVKTKHENKNHKQFKRSEKKDNDTLSTNYIPIPKVHIIR